VETKSPPTGAGIYNKNALKNKRMTEVIITALLSSVTGLTGWIFGRRKNIAQVRTIELDNIEKAVEIWRNLAESYALKLTVIQAEIDKVSAENKSLKVEIDSMRDKLAKLSSDNKTLNRKVEILTKNQKDNETV
jgi:chromosome segregation ATPase